MIVASRIPFAVVAGWLVAPLLATGSPSHLRRSLQEENDPCVGVLGEDVLFQPYPYDLLGSDFYEECFGSLTVDKDKMLEHIVELNAAFAQFHSFYDLARDPENSDPISHQAELGYSLVGEGEGMVDLRGGLFQIYEAVNSSSASLQTFWDIQTLFNRLYDFHVSLPSKSDNFNIATFQLIPDRLSQYSTSGIAGVVPEFGYDGNLTLSVTWLFEDGSQSDSVEVALMNGMTVQSFYEDLANNPAIQNNYQSVGARLNALLKQGGLLLQNYFLTARPSDILPPSFEVYYYNDDGSIGGNETWYTGVWAPFFSKVYYPVSEGAFAGVNTTAAEGIMNKPGSMYETVNRALGKIFEVEDEEAVDDATAVEKAAVKQMPSAAYEFEGTCISRSDNGEVCGCYKIEGDHAVVKLSSFTVDYIDIFYFWKNVTIASKAAGVTNVVVDISSNGGGIVLTGYVLILAMFPNLDVALLENAWDVVYNEPMNVFYNDVLPIVLGILEWILSLGSETFDIEALEAVLADITAVEMQQLQIAAESMRELCTVVDAFDGVVGEYRQCETLNTLVTNVTSFTSIGGDIPGYFGVLSQAAQALLEHNPWSVVFGMGGQSETIKQMDTLSELGPITVFRGGAEKNFTQKFDLINITLIENLAVAINAEMAEVDHTFDKYVVVSDGAAGSMAAIFTNTISQLWKNVNVSGVNTEVVTVAYGGTGRQDDMTMASVPASVQGVSLEDPFIASGLMFIIRTLLPQNNTYYDAFEEAWFDYDAAVAYPPYFAGTLPRMPVVGFYNAFMEPGAMPLQYVKIPPDEYLPFWFPKVDFGNTADLKELYATVASAFLGPSAV